MAFQARVTPPLPFISPIFAFLSCLPLLRFIFALPLSLPRIYRAVALLVSTPPSRFSSSRANSYLPFRIHPYEAIPTSSRTDPGGSPLCSPSFLHLLLQSTSQAVL